MGQRWGMIHPGAVFLSILWTCETRQVICFQNTMHTGIGQTFPFQKGKVRKKREKSGGRYQASLKPCKATSIRCYGLRTTQFGPTLHPLGPAGRQPCPRGPGQQFHPTELRRGSPISPQGLSSHAHSQTALLVSPVKSQKSNNLPSFCSVSAPFSPRWQHFCWDG